MLSLYIPSSITELAKAKRDSVRLLLLRQLSIIFFISYPLFLSRITPNSLRTSFLYDLSTNPDSKSISYASELLPFPMILSMLSSSSDRNRQGLTTSFINSNKYLLHSSFLIPSLSKFYITCRRGTQSCFVVLYFTLSANWPHWGGLVSVLIIFSMIKLLIGNITQFWCDGVQYSISTQFIIPTINSTQLTLKIVNLIIVYNVFQFSIFHDIP